MSTPNAIFRECHRLRKHLKALQEEIDRGPRVLKARQARLAQEQQAHKDHHDGITRLKLKIREEEGTLRQTETRLAKLEEQLTKISVTKEYEAKQSEIRQAKEKKEATEDAILTTMGQLEEATTAVLAIDKQWADAQAEFTQWMEEGKARLERLKADQVHSQAALVKTEAEIPAKFKTTYDYLVKAHGPDAMTPVKDRVCQACRTQMHDQKAMEVNAGGYALCSTCGKILYPGE
jgi:predicted  nucleic acid-binding Zn-ribbon protein